MTIHTEDNLVNSLEAIMIKYNDFYTVDNIGNCCNQWYLPDLKLAEAAAIMNVPQDQENEWCDNKHVVGFCEKEAFDIVAGSNPCLTCSCHGSGCNEPNFTCYQDK